MSNNRDGRTNSGCSDKLSSHSSDFPDADSSPFSIKHKDEITRTLEELIQTEETYVNELEMFVTTFYDQLREFVSPKRLPLIFPTVAIDILSIHKRLYTSFKDIPDVSSEPWRIFDAFRTVLPHFSIYKRYALIHDDCASEFKIEMSKNKKLKKFVKHFCETNCKPVDSMFIVPIQRLPRYMLLFNQLSKLSQNDLKVVFDKTSAEIVEILEDINDAKNWFDHSKINKDLVGKIKRSHRKSIKLQNKEDIQILYQTRAKIDAGKHDMQSEMFIQPKRCVFELPNGDMQIFPLSSKYMKFEETNDPRGFILWTGKKITCEDLDSKDQAKLVLGAIQKPIRQRLPTVDFSNLANFDKDSLYGPDVVEGEPKLPPFNPGPVEFKDSFRGRSNAVLLPEDAKKAKLSALKVDMHAKPVNKNANALKELEDAEAQSLYGCQANSCCIS